MIDKFEALQQFKDEIKKLINKKLESGESQSIVLQALAQLSTLQVIKLSNEVHPKVLSRKQLRDLEKVV